MHDIQKMMDGMRDGARRTADGQVITESDYTLDNVPVVDDAVPSPGADHTEETPGQWRRRRQRLHRKQQGMWTETELLDDSAVYDNDLAVENLENDNP